MREAGAVHAARQIIAGARAGQGAGLPIDVAWNAGHLRLGYAQDIAGKITRDRRGAGDFPDTWAIRDGLARTAAILPETDPAGLHAAEFLAPMRVEARLGCGAEFPATLQHLKITRIPALSG